MKRAIKFTSVMLLIAAAFCLLYFIYLAIFKGFDDVIIFFWPIATAVFGLTAALGLFSLKRSAVLRGVALLPVVVIIGFVISFGSFVAELYSVSSKSPPQNAEYLVVLGAAVNGSEPSRALQQRIDAAYEYLIASPETRVVCTGGQDEYDEISEAACIARELEKLGISSDRILIEDKSTSTRENIEFTLQKLGVPPKSIVIVSNGFHLRRAKLILEEYYGGEIYTLAAKTDIFIIHYTVREYIIRFLGME